jgi:hypothetical protein
MYYKYSIKGISIRYDSFFGKVESDFMVLFPLGTTLEEAKKDFEKKQRDTKHYKNLSLYRQVYIHYEGEKEKLF